jgi:UDP-N-acetylglucosamine acyltransferase
MNNRIHATAVIEGDVHLGEGNVIGPYCVLIGPLVIGSRNHIGPSAVIGTPGQDTRDRHYDSSQRSVVIGDDNIIREFVAIQKPAYTKRETRIGSNVFLMQGVHIPHDAVVEDDVVITPNVVLAGMAHVMQGANLALSSAVAQYVVVGAHAIVAANAAVVRNVRPFSKFIPGRPLAVNDVGIARAGFGDFEPEIRAFVLEGTEPTSPELKSIILRYRQLIALNEVSEY